MHGEINILLFDFIERDVESALNQFGILGSAKVTKGCIAFIGRNRQVRCDLVNRFPLHASTSQPFKWGCGPGVGA